jgi:hypothetical protein
LVSREAGTKIGPLIHPDAFARVNGIVEHALDDGASPDFSNQRI